MPYVCLAARRSADYLDLLAEPTATRPYPEREDDDA